MSLIPSESYSFPDNYSPVAARRSRTLKDRDAAPRPVNRLENISLPGPIRVEENITLSSTPALETNPIDAPTQSATEQFFQAFGKIAEQNAAPVPEHEESLLPSQQVMPLETNVMPAAAPDGTEMFLQALGLMANPSVVQPPPPQEMISEPPRIPLAPRKVRPVAPPPASEDVSLSTANGHGRSRNLRPNTPVLALQRLAVPPIPEIEPALDNQLSEPPPFDPFTEVPVTAEPLEQFDFGDEAAAAPYLRQRRRKKVARFFLLEFMAIAVLIPSAGVVLSHDLTNRTLVTLMNILTISAAAAVAIIPIMVFAIGPAFTRDRRM